MLKVRVSELSAQVVLLRVRSCLIWSTVGHAQASSHHHTTVVYGVAWVVLCGHDSSWAALVVHIVVGSHHHVAVVVWELLLGLANGWSLSSSQESRVGILRAPHLPKAAGDTVITRSIQDIHSTYVGSLSQPSRLERCLWCWISRLSCASSIRHSR